MLRFHSMYIFHLAIVAAVIDFEAAVADITNTYTEAVAGLPTTERIDYSIPIGLEF